MNYSRIKLNPENFNLGGRMIATDVHPAFEYKDGERTEKAIGIKVTVAMEKNGYDTLTVTVSNPVDTLSAVLEAADGPVYVTFDGFAARIYTTRSDGNVKVGVSAKATGVRVVTDDLLNLDI